VPETDHQQIGLAVVIEIEPERVGCGVALVVPVRHPGAFGHVRESKVPIVVIKVVLPAQLRIRHEDVVISVPVIIGHRSGRAKRRITCHDLGVRIVEHPVAVPGVDARLPGDILKPAVRHGFVRQ